MSDAIVIRQAQADDLDDVLALWQYLDAYQARLDPTLRPVDDAERLWASEFKVLLHDKEGGCFLVAEDEGRIVGLVTARAVQPRPLYTPQPYAFVDEVVVDPGWRGRGVATRLIGTVQAWAQSHGLARVEARVVAANEHARAFWRRVGAKEVAVTVRLDTSARHGTGASEADSVP
ncbi:MAG: GNAT family N-acetyltransferase [Bacteroidota bacterium]